jgi:hypothetical protein
MCHHALHYGTTKQHRVTSLETMIFTCSLFFWTSSIVHKLDRQQKTHKFNSVHFWKLYWYWYWLKLDNYFSRFEHLDHCWVTSCACDSVMVLQRTLTIMVGPKPSWDPSDITSNDVEEISILCLARAGHWWSVLWEGSSSHFVHMTFSGRPMICRCCLSVRWPFSSPYQPVGSHIQISWYTNHSCRLIMEWTVVTV